jgi:hypothetical protein
MRPRRLQGSIADRGHRPPGVKKLLESKAAGRRSASAERLSSSQRSRWFGSSGQSLIAPAETLRRSPGSTVPKAAPGPNRPERSIESSRNGCCDCLSSWPAIRVPLKPAPTMAMVGTASENAMVCQWLQSFADRATVSSSAAFQDPSEQGCWSRCIQSMSPRRCGRSDIQEDVSAQHIEGWLHGLCCRTRSRFYQE